MFNAKTKMKFASLFVVGGCVFQLGGCFGDFLNLTLREIPVGFGRSIGATPAAIVNDIIAPLIAGLTGG